MVVTRIAVVAALAVIMPSLALADVGFAVGIVEPPIGWTGISLRDVNTNGDMVGLLKNGSIETGDFRSAAYFASKTKIQLLRTPPGDPTNYAPSVLSDNGSIVGFQLDTDRAVFWINPKKPLRTIVPDALRTKVTVIDGRDLRFVGFGNALTKSGLLVGTYLEGIAGSFSTKGFIFDINKRKFSSSSTRFIGQSDDGVALTSQGPFLSSAVGVITDFMGKKQRRRSVKGLYDQIAIARDSRLYGSIKVGTEETACAVWMKPTGSPTVIDPKLGVDGFCAITALAGVHAVGLYESGLSVPESYVHYFHFNLKKGNSTVIPTTTTDPAGQTVTNIQPLAVLPNGTIYGNGFVAGKDRIVVLTPQ